jgi:branched-chain amino acid transport system ATP-binding protein
MLHTAVDLATRQAATTNALLELKTISACYSSHQILHDISLTIYPGEVVCLLGEGTSGKTTLLKVIQGLHRPCIGEVLLNGSPITLLSNTEIIRQGLVVAPDVGRIFPNLTIEENLGLGAYSGRDRRAIRKDMRRVFHIFPWLGDRRYQKAGTLTLSEQRILTLARALMSQPKVLCIDEPTRGLTPASTEQIVSACMELRRSGVTLFIVEQKAEPVLSIATRAYLLQGNDSSPRTACELFSAQRLDLKRRSA